MVGWAAATPAGAAYQATGTTFSLMLRSDGTAAGMQPPATHVKPPGHTSPGPHGAAHWKFPGGYCTHTVPGAHPKGRGPQQVLPGGAATGRQHGPVGPPATHVDKVLTQTTGPQQVWVAGVPEPQNGGVN